MGGWIGTREPDVDERGDGGCDSVGVISDGALG